MSSGGSYRFSGFPEGTASAVTLPELVFTELITQIEDVDELRVILIVLWRLAKMRSEAAPWITDAELHADVILRKALGGEAFDLRLDEALSRIVVHGILIDVPWERADGSVETRYFANSPKGRAAVAALRRGTGLTRTQVQDRPNIFTLYEQNIGPLTALLSEDLMEAEQMYPASWIEDAFREAVALNKRNWKYIRAILERWQAEGRDEINAGSGRRPGEPPSQRDREAERQRYIRDAYDRLVRH
jgi:DnaD/phage-associated family protein